MASMGAISSASGSGVWLRRTPMILAPNALARVATPAPMAPKPMISQVEPATSRTSSSRQSFAAWAARRSGQRWKWSRTPAIT